MKQSELYVKTLREAPADEEAKNAKLLIRAGFIHKEMAGVYSYLPLGLRVLRNIENVVREEMNAIGGNEVLLTSLQPKESWQQTGRWDSENVLFKLPSQTGKTYVLGPTHEEIIAPLAKQFISSYRDLPSYYFQIHTKFRDELRAKSGLLRGREFLMKDLYSFHRNQQDLENYYGKVEKAYIKIFKRLSLKAVKAEASGGTFSKYSHEYQVLHPVGEDVVFYCDQIGKGCDFAQNKEIFTEKEWGVCKRCGKGKIVSSNAAEVGNIFKLGTKYTEPFSVKYKDEEGKEALAIMGCYGIGISRLMGLIAEINNDEGGLIWPEQIAPFRVHLIELKKGLGKNLYKSLSSAKSVLQPFQNDILYDDREAKPGEKFKDSDLIGIPWRAVVSERTGSKVELKRRGKKTSKLVSYAHISKLI